MSYLEKVYELSLEPEQLELAYHEAVKAGEGETFADALHAAHAESGDNLLFAAWHYRLVYATTQAARRVIAWSWALPLAVISALLLWLVSDEKRYALQVTNTVSGYQEQYATPSVVLLAASIASVLIIIFLAGTGDRYWRRVPGVALALAGFTAYVLLVYPQTGTRVYQEEYLALMTMNLTLLSWTGIGVYALADHWDASNRFAFLIKSLEFVVVAGLFGLILALFMAVTFGLFGALGIEPPDGIGRLFFAGGAGIVAVLAVALVVEPGITPQRQFFDDGTGRLVPLLLRLLLPLALVVLTIFVCRVYTRQLPRAVRESRRTRCVQRNAVWSGYAVVGVVPVDRTILASDCGFGCGAEWLR